MKPIWAKKAGSLPFSTEVPADKRKEAGKPEVMGSKGTVTDIPVANTHYEMNLAQKVRSAIKNK